MSKKAKMLKKPSEKDQIPLIVAIQTQTEQIGGGPKRKADRVGVEDSLLGDAYRRLTTGKMPIYDLDEQMAKIVKHIQAAIGVIKASKIGDFELSGVEIGLAISADGTLGIVSAGLETSMTLSFSRPE